MYTISNGRKFFISNAMPTVSIESNSFLTLISTVTYAMQKLKYSWTSQIHIREARDHCCALGMKQAEIYSSTDVTEIGAIAASKNILLLSYQRANLHALLEYLTYNF